MYTLRGMNSAAFPVDHFLTEMLRIEKELWKHLPDLLIKHDQGKLMVYVV